MSRPVAPIVCDGPGCRNQKQETNRWWTIEAWLAEPLGTGASARLTRLVVIPGTSVDPGVEDCDLYDFCGQTCALKWVSEQMSKVVS